MAEGLTGQEQVSVGQRELLSRIDEIHVDVESFGKRLSRLANLEALVEEKYRKKQETLQDEFKRVERHKGELKSLAKQLKKNKARRLILKKQIGALEKQQKIIPETMKQITGYEKSSSEQIEVIKEERQIICQRVYDLMQMLELAEKAELSEKELETVYQRAHATRRLLEEHEGDLRKRTVDLLFDFYIPPRNKRLGW